jgi:phosphoglycolate phosphatase
MKYTTVLFDFDGTLADSSKLIIPSIRYTYRKMELQTPPNEILHKFIGPPLHEAFRVIGMPTGLIDRAVEIYRECFNDRNFMDINLFDGIEYLLKTLKDSGVRLAVASVRIEDKLKEICSEIRIDRYFEAVCGRVEEEGVLTKADVIRRALHQLGNPKGKTVLVGDSDFDEEGAAEAGIDFIAVMYGFGFDSKADIQQSVYIADTVIDLAEYLINP